VSSLCDLCDVVEQICLDLPTTLPDRSWLAIACFLVDYGADLDAVDIRGNTPVSHIKNDAIINLLRKRARLAPGHF